MKPAEEIGIDELNESGIVHVGLEFCPTIGFDEMGEPFLSGTSAFHFIDRYNNKKIALQISLAAIWRMKIYSLVCIA